MNRRFAPNDDVILFHYCDATSFHAILTSHRMRFSDANQLNDYAEGRWGYKIFEEAATELLKRKPPPRVAAVDQVFLDKVDEIFSPHQAVLFPLLACYSQDGDVLSQWRAYADDGAGFAIGFSAHAIAKMGVNLLEVEYDHSVQVHEMAAALTTIFARAQQNQFGKQFTEDVLLLAAYAYAYKNPAFREEREIRAVRLVNPLHDEGASRLVDPGGMTKPNGSRLPGEPIQFKIREGSIIPFVDLPFRKKPTVKSVFLGPKNPNREGNVSLILGSNNYPAVTIRRSAATYR